MKKIILTLALLVSVVFAQAQVTVEGSKFTDNWSITLKGGAVMPMHHYGFWKNARGIAGMEIRKQITTVFGIGAEGEVTFNTSSWDDDRAYFGMKNSNIVDHQLVGLFGTINLMNAFAGYKGEPRAFEMEAQFGGGWWHAYRRAEGMRNDYNSWYTKAGMNFNFNLGEAKAWTFSLKPSVAWNMNGDIDDGHVLTYKAWNGDDNALKSRFNANHAWVELEAGITYHFGNSNGQHYFTICPKQYTQADIDAVNAQVNDLRNQLANAQSDLDAARNRNAQLQRDLDNCRAEKNKVQTKEIVKNVENGFYEVNVFFQVNKSNITNAQMPNVERVASFLKSHPNAKVEIRGYASPEGPKDVNERLANERAASVKNTLVKKYGIAANRIDAKGLGVGDMFEEPTWNRVSICTIDNSKK